MPLPLLPTSLVGSNAQPAWLIDREKLAGRFPPRVRAKELWRVAPEWLDEAQDDATRIAILDQERAGLDIVTDGEMRRESYSNRFATALARQTGVDRDRSVRAGLRSAGKALRQDHHPRYARPVGHGHRDSGDGRRAHPPRAAACAGRATCRRARLRPQIFAACGCLRKNAGMVAGAAIVRREIAGA
jgi:hypothetical protein